MATSLTLAQIASRATELAGGRLDWTLSDASFYANRAIGYLWQNVGPPTRFDTFLTSSTTSGGYRIPLGTNYVSIVALSLGSRVGSAMQWTQLTKQDAAWQAVFADNEAGGKPEAYREFATYLELIPYPNSTYSVLQYYTVEQPELVNTGDVITWDKHWDWAVVLKTSELLAATRSDFELEALARNRFLDYVSVMIPDQDRRTTDARSLYQPSGGTR